MGAPLLTQSEWAAIRFWPRVVKSDGCWLWTGGTSRGGYGRVQFRGKLTQATRAAWVITSGEIPSGLFVCHRCDNPPCVNPAHLFLGTHAENMRDRLEKNRVNRRDCRRPERVLRGAAAPQSKLTEEQVLEIRALWAGGGLSRRALARVFAINPQTVTKIVTGRTWRHLLPGSP